MDDPVAIPLQLLSAALVTGNPVVFKPSERASLVERTAGRAAVRGPAGGRRQPGARRLPAHQAQVATGVLLGFIAALAAPGIAIALYPVLRRFGVGLALGAVGFRIIEGVFYALGMLVLLLLSTLSREFVDAGAPGDQHYTTLGHTMLAQYHWLVDAGLLLAFSLGGLMYYLVFYRSKLIPTWLSAWGIAGAVLLMVAAVLIIFGVIAPLSAGQVALAVPIGVQEMVLAVWLIGKGFDQAALTGRRVAGDTRA